MLMQSRIEKFLLDESSGYMYRITNDKDLSAVYDGTADAPGLKIKLRCLRRETWNSAYSRLVQWDKVGSCRLPAGEKIPDEVMNEILFSVFDPEGSRDTGWKIVSVTVDDTSSLSMLLVNKQASDLNEILGERADALEKQGLEHNLKAVPDEFILQWHTDNYISFEIAPSETDRRKYEIGLHSDHVTVEEECEDFVRELYFREDKESSNVAIVEITEAVR